MALLPVASNYSNIASFDRLLIKSYLMDYSIFVHYSIFRSILQSFTNARVLYFIKALKLLD